MCVQPYTNILLGGETESDVIDNQSDVNPDPATATADDDAYSDDGSTGGPFLCVCMGVCVCVMKGVSE